MRALDEDWRGTPAAVLAVDKIESDESSANCVFAETNSHRFRLCDRGDFTCVVLGVEELKCTDETVFENAKRFVKEHPYKAAIVGLPPAVAGAGAAATAAGFGAAGIVGGSVAAGVQSGMGYVAAGSWFATMQSLGMTGTFAAMSTYGGIAAGASSIAVVATRNKSDSETQEESEEKDTGEKSGSSNEAETDANRGIVDMRKYIGWTARFIDLKKLVIFYEI